MDLVKSLWRGDISLARTFWFFGLCVHALLSAGESYLIRLHNQAPLPSAGFMSLRVLQIFSIIYDLFIFICIWRSANKYEGSQSYAIAAKAMVILG